jgi:hypothetical protein
MHSKKLDLQYSFHKSKNEQNSSQPFVPQQHQACENELQAKIQEVRGKKIITRVFFKNIEILAVVPSVAWDF